MGHEISQFDIQDRQLLAGNPQPRTGIVTDLGEAKITRTIFGRTRVRVIREQDRKRRAWQLAILVVTAIAAAAWQGWIIFQKMQYVAPHVPLSERIQVSAPVFRPAYIAPDPHPSEQKSESLIQTEIDGLLSGPLPRHPPGWTPPEREVMDEPSMANQAKAKQVATANSSMKQTGTQHPVKPSVAPQPVAATVATTPQLAAHIPVAVVPLAGPLAKRDASTPSSAGNGQLQGPVSVQD